MRIAVLYRKLDPRFQKNFAVDTDGREDDSYHLSIVEALRRKGHDAFPFRVQEDHLEQLGTLDCDLAFNLVEEGLNNDAALEPHLPAILDVYGIPYTGGDFLSIALTQDKARTKEILGFHGIPTPAFQVFAAADDPLQLAFPLIVKPLHEDAGIGVFRDSVVSEEHALRRLIRRVLRRYRQPAIVEQYVDGRELSVGVIEQGARKIVTPVNEVVFNTPPGVPRVYTYTAKWDNESEEYASIVPDQCPAENLPPELETEIRRLALRAFEALRLRGYARVDFRLDADGRLSVLEVNSNPLIGDSSCMATMAEKMGWPFPKLVHTIALEAYRRAQRENRAVTLRTLAASAAEEEDEAKGQESPPEPRRAGEKKRSARA
jgi:D-alanine-D-alanine ligase